MNEFQQIRNAFERRTGRFIDMDEIVPSDLNPFCEDGEESFYTWHTLRVLLDKDDPFMDHFQNVANRNVARLERLFRVND